MPQSTTVQANLQFNTASLNQSSRQVQQALGRITGQASEFQKSLDASTARVFAFGATTTVLQAVSQSFKKLVSTTIEVEKRLVEINSIFQASASEFNKFRNAIFQVAKDTGQAFSTVADGAAELARQGLSAEETAKRLEAALILTRISGLDAEKSVKSLTAAINGFASAGLSAEQIVNKMVAVDTAFAVSAQDLADGFARAGSTAEDAGVSFDELLGLITAVEQRTARGGAVIGNAFKSIFTRLSRGKTIDELQSLGVAIDANQTGIQKLQALSAALEEISDPTVASQIKELAGGVFQINVVSSTLKDLSSDTSIFAAAAATAANATNEAFEKNALLNQSLAAQINSLVVSLTSFGEKIGQLTIAPLLGNLVTIATKVSEAFDKALDPEKGNAFIRGIFKAVGSFISGPGLVLITTAFLKITMLVAKFAKEGFQAVLNIGSAQQKQAQIQGGIVGLLQRDAQLRKILNSTTATQAQKEQAVIQAIQRENQLLQQQQSLLQNIVGLAARRGVAGYSSSGGFTGKGGKRFASGFQAEEATAMMLGANSGVKAQYGKGTIGGRRFIMNNQEMEITNFGRNGDSAVIPKYAKGFVPNFAKTKKKVEALQPNQLPTIIAPTGSSGIVSYAPKDYPYSFNFRAVTSSDGEMDNLAAYFAKNYDTKKVSDLLKNRAKKDVNKLSKELKISPEKPSSIGEIRNPKGFEGAVGAVMGSVFDSALSAMFASEQYDGDGGDFDVRKPSPEALKNMQILFGKDVLNKRAGKVGKADFSLMGDYKSDAFSKNTKESMFKKVKNELAWMELDKTQQNRKIKSKQNRMRYKGRAAGYIPNFNSMNKGIPVSQIRAHFDPMGNPVAVTNTRDEPNGLKDAIGRERQGIGMAASGFVPNFISGAGIQQTNFKALQAASEASKKAAESMDVDKVKDSTSKMIGFQMALSGLTAVVSAVSNAKQKEVTKIEDSITKKEAEIANIEKATEDKIQEINQSKLSEAAKKEEIAAIEESAKAQKNGVQASITLLNSQLKVAEASSSSAESISNLTETVTTIAGSVMALNMLIEGGLRAAIVKLITYLNTQQMFGGGAAGRLAAASGIVAAAFVIKEAVLYIQKSSNESKLKEAGREMTRFQNKITLESVQKTTGMGRLSMESYIPKTKDDLPYAKKFNQDSRRLLELEQQIRKNMQADKPVFDKKIAEEYKDLYFQLALHKKTNYESLKIEVKINETKQKILEEYKKQQEAAAAGVAAAKKSKDTIDFYSGIQAPQNMGAFYGRMVKGEQAINDLNFNRANLNQAEGALSLAIQRKEVTVPQEGETASEPYLKYQEAITKAADEVKKSANIAAQTLRNNIVLAAEELKTASIELKQTSKQLVDNRLSLAEGLKGKKINMTAIESAITKAKNAKTPEEKLEAAIDMAQLQDELAFAPELFENLMKKFELDIQELTETMYADYLKGQKVGSSVVEGTVMDYNETQPDVGAALAKVNQLQVALDLAKKREEEMQEAFGTIGEFEEASKKAKMLSDALQLAAEDASKTADLINKMTTTTDSAIEAVTNSKQIMDIAKGAAKNFKDSVEVMKKEIRDLVTKTNFHENVIKELQGKFS